MRCVVGKSKEELKIPVYGVAKLEHTNLNVAGVSPAIFDLVTRLYWPKVTILYTI